LFRNTLQKMNQENVDWSSRQSLELKYEKISMDLRFAAVMRKPTAATNFERLVNCIVPARLSDSDSDEEDKTVTLDSLFECFRVASSHGVKLQLKAGASQIKADF